MPRELRDDRSEDSSVDYHKIAVGFKYNGTAYLNNLISREECKELADLLRKDKEENPDVPPDSQCPLSWSTYHNKHLQEKLHSLAGPIGERLGLELIPTYVFARIYVPGETLHAHRDRPACEISTTLTLDVDEDSEIWPIYFEGSDEPFIIEVGDAVAYTGEVLTHWREKYEGKEQIQVFFHYIQESNPIKDEILKAEQKSQAREIKAKEIKKGDFDYKYQGLNIKRRQNPLEMADSRRKNTNRRENWITTPDRMSFLKGLMPGQEVMQTNPQPLQPFIFLGQSRFAEQMQVESPIDESMCLQLYRDFVMKGDSGMAFIGLGGGNADAKVRNVKSFYYESPEIVDFLNNMIRDVNSSHWNMRLTQIETPHICVYDGDVRGHYTWHRDSTPIDQVPWTRKLSVSTLINDADEYEGGELQLLLGLHADGKPIVITPPLKKAGDTVIFLSEMYHRVKPVTKGLRKALVTWMIGPTHK